MAQSSTAPRLKVLFLTEWYPTRQQPVGGIFVREHAKAVQLYDDVVVLHCAGADPKLSSLWRMEEEFDEHLSEGVPTYRVWRRRLPVRRIGYLLYLWSVVQAFRHLRAQGFQPDIIHGHIYEAGAAAVTLGKLFGVPAVVTEHSSAFPRGFLQGPDLWKPRLTFKWADMVMPVSRALQQAIESYGITAQFRVIPNVVDPSVFFPRPGPRPGRALKRLLFVGALEPSHVKGVPYLLRALAQLCQHRDDWRLDVVGDGPARTEYERLAGELQLGEYITFHGLKSKQEVAEFMRRADLFVLPSLWENLPCVLIEAIASGLPIVASRIGGIPELVDQETGMLVPAKDVTKLSFAIAEMLTAVARIDPRWIAQKAGKYSPEAVGREIDSIYRQVLHV